MASKRAFAGGAMAYLWLMFVTEVTCKTAIRHSFNCPGALYVFGDSQSDPGNSVEAFPFRADAKNPPYGSTFFGTPSGRYSDGRLIVDFLASAFGFPFIDPYFKNIVPDYRHGINFAVSGATALNVTDPVPFFLRFQTDQFIRFKNNVVAAAGNQTQDCPQLLIPSVDSFGSGLYLVFIGGNDVFKGFLETPSPLTVQEIIVPQVVKAVSKAVKDLYAEEARNLFIFNVIPIGCTPMLLSVASLGHFNSKDKFGCLEEYNKVVEYYNSKLEEALDSLRLELIETTMHVVAMEGGAYNFNISIFCGSQEIEACRNPNEYISWDGSHFTEAFNKQFVKEILKGNYLDPPIKLTKVCDLHISQFEKFSYTYLSRSAQL